MIRRSTSASDFTVMSVPGIEHRLLRWPVITALGLGVIDLLLGGVVATEIFTPRQTDAVGAPAAAAVRLAAARRDEFALLPIAAYAVVTERPLFARHRRPFARRGAAASEITDVKSLVLVGITISGLQRIALVRHGAPPTVARLWVGAEIGGWTVRSIDEERLVLAKPTAEYTIQLYKAETAPK
jgi:hypothetical protein